jgi:hypothetical protein
LTFRDFEEFFACLNANRVRYLVVGPYAVGFHARPRATKDIDVLVDRTLANARRTRAAIASFLGSQALGVSAAKLMNPRTLVVLGVAPIRIDILTSIDGVRSFAGAWQRRVEGRYGETRVHFISMQDLVASKVAAGRPQDLADVDVLTRVAARAKTTGSAKRTRRARTPRSG